MRELTERESRIADDLCIARHSYIVSANGPCPTCRAAVVRLVDGGGEATDERQALHDAIASVVGYYNSAIIWDAVDGILARTHAQQAQEKGR